MIEHPFGEFVADDKTDGLNGPGSTRYIFTFPNGYGASVVRHYFSYGNENGEGLWEMAVLDSSGSLDYSTPITGNVLGHLKPFEVGRTLEAIAKLPNPTDPAEV